MNFGRFWEDLGRIFGRFLDYFLRFLHDFWMIFGRCLEIVEGFLG